MQNLSLLNEYHKKFAKDFYALIPDGIYFINLALLHQFDLLHFQPDAEPAESVLSQQFFVIEAPEKITLVNDQFIVWIMPEIAFDTSLTYVLIALNRGEQEPQLEAAFIASGIYNSSRLVLKILEKLLLDIQETEEALAHLQKEKSS